MWVFPLCRHHSETRTTTTTKISIIAYMYTFYVVKSTLSSHCRSLIRISQMLSATISQLYVCVCVCVWCVFFSLLSFHIPFATLRSFSFSSSVVPTKSTVCSFTFWYDMIMFIHQNSFWFENFRLSFLGLSCFFFVYFLLFYSLLKFFEFFLWPFDVHYETCDQRTFYSFYRTISLSCYVICEPSNIQHTKLIHIWCCLTVVHMCFL